MSTHAQIELVDDFELLDRWHRGQRDAGDEIVRRYFPHVFKLVTLAVSDSDRPQLVSDTFDRLRHVGPRMPRPASFIALVLNLVMNELYRLLNKRTDGFDPDTKSLVDARSNASSWVSSAVRTEVTIECLRGLPVNQKELIEFHYWQQLAVDELAAVFAWSAAEVEARLEQALEALGERVAEQAPEGKTIDVRRRLEILRVQLGFDALDSQLPPSGDEPRAEPSDGWVAFHGSAVSRDEARQVLVALAKLYEEDTGDTLQLGG